MVGLDADLLNIVLYYAMTVLCLPFLALFIYILIVKSPPSMRIYRNTLLNMMLWYLVATISYGFFLQPVYARKRCIHLYGWGAFLGAPGVYASVYGSAITVLNAGTSIVVCFFYRYVTLVQPMLRKRSVVVGVLAQCMATVIAVILGSMVHYYGTVNDDNGINLLCPDRANRLNIALGSTVAVVFVTLTAVGVCFVVMSIVILQRQRHLMSKRTYELQRTLTFSLLVLAGPPIAFNAVPITTAGIAIAMDSTHVDLILALASHIPLIEVMLICVLTISVVKPYRLAAKQMFLWRYEEVTRLCLLMFPKMLRK